MLLSLAKIILFIIVVAAAATGAGWLVQIDGGVQIAFANTELNLGPLQAVIVFVIALILLWIALRALGLLFATVRFLNGDETAVSRYFYRNRERRGYKALSDAMLALASGEGQLAITKAERAERSLNRPDFTDLIVAQASQMIGDTARAEAVYKKLLAEPATRFVGVRGLLNQRLAAGDTDTAMKLAEKAFALKPRHVETQDALLQLQAQTGDWAGARKTLGAKLRHGSLPRDVHRRRDAVLAVSEANSIVAEDATIEMREAAIEANRLSPDLVPAAALAARQYARNEQSRYAARVIRKAWEVAPHPDLAAAFAEIAPEETPQQRINRFQTLFRIHSDHPETRMLEAELLIAAEDFPAAVARWVILWKTTQPHRALTIMAAVERGEGSDDAVVRGLLAKALVAPRGPQWVCDSCQHISPGWRPVCENCQGFDTLSWREPPQSEVALPAGSEMLPLIVGQITTDRSETADEDLSEDFGIDEPTVIDAEVVDAEIEDQPAKG